jgi:hypothetical protein
MSPAVGRNAGPLPDWLTPMRQSRTSRELHPCPSTGFLLMEDRSAPAQTCKETTTPAEAGATVSVCHGPSVSFLARAEAAATPISIINPKKGNEDA